MILPHNITYLYENNQLGVFFKEEGPLQVIDENEEVVLELKPNQVYPVIYLSLEDEIGIMLIDEDNSMTFNLDNQSLEFIDTCPDMLN